MLMYGMPFFLGLCGVFGRSLNLRSFQRIESLLLRLKFFFLRSLYNGFPDMHGSTLIINLGQSHRSYMGLTRMHEYMQ